MDKWRTGERKKKCQTCKATQHYQTLPESLETIPLKVALVFLVEPMPQGQEASSVMPTMDVVCTEKAQMEWASWDLANWEPVSWEKVTQYKAPEYMVKPMQKEGVELSATPTMGEECTEKPKLEQAYGDIVRRELVLLVRVKQDLRVGFKGMSKSRATFA